MKVILTGATGFIGGEVLNQCIARPEITSIVALSRRDLTGTAANSPKVKTIIIKDFLNYPDTVLQELKDADICIWSLGTYNGGEAIEVAYPVAFCNALSQVQGDTSGTPFRLVFLSGALVVNDQNASLWLFSIPRKAKGLAETKLFEFADQRKQNQRPWEVYVVRPAYVSPKLRGIVLAALTGNWWMLRIDELGAAMVDTALDGHAERKLLHRALVAKGQSALKKRQELDRTVEH